MSVYLFYVPYVKKDGKYSIPEKWIPKDAVFITDFEAEDFIKKHLAADPELSNAEYIISWAHLTPEEVKCFAFNGEFFTDQEKLMECIERLGVTPEPEKKEY